MFEAGIVEVRVVRDEDGTPIPGAAVRLDQTYEDTHDDVHVSTDARGMALFTGLGLGWTAVDAAATGRSRAEATVDIRSDTPHVSVELRLRPQREVVVRLLDALGRPFRAEDWHLDRPTSNRLGIRLTQTCGVIGSSPDRHDSPSHRSRSMERELGPYTWNLELQGPADCVLAVLGDVIVGAAPLDPSATELAVRVDPAAIASALAPVVVRVLAAAGDVPIEGARVELDANDVKFMTGTDGRVCIGFAYSRFAKLVVKARGFAPAVIAVVRPFPHEFVARLAPGRRIEGRVVDQDGSPISGARIELARPGPGVAASMRSAAGGVFRFHDLPSAEFEVHATYRAKSSAVRFQRVTATVDCRERDVLQLELTIPMRITDAPSKPR